MDPTKIQDLEDRLTGPVTLYETTQGQTIGAHWNFYPAFQELSLHGRVGGVVRKGGGGQYVISPSFFFMNSRTIFS